MGSAQVCPELGFSAGSHRARGDALQVSHGSFGWKGLLLPPHELLSQMALMEDGQLAVLLSYLTSAGQF